MRESRIGTRFLVYGAGIPHENPSIGVLLCRDKDDEVVEYALSRSISPTIVADYEIKLIPKETLRRKLNEFYELLSDRLR